MRIKILSARSIRDLEGYVNDWLGEHNTTWVKSVDVKHSRMKDGYIAIIFYDDFSEGGNK